MNLLQLKERRANVWSQMTSILDTAEAENRELTAEESSTYDAAEADLDKLSADIDRLERHANRGGFDERGTNTATPEHREDGGGDDREAEYREAFIAYVQRGMAELDADQRKVLRTGYVKDEQRAQAVGTTTAGGYLVPDDYRRQLVETMKAYGSVQSVAQVLPTNTGATLPWPTNDDTGNMGALLAENTQATEQDLVFGMADLGAYKYTSKIVRVSLEFLQDVDWIDAEGFLRRKFAERLGRIHNVHFTTGTGVNQPQGIVTGAASGVTAAAVAAITSDELIDLQHSIDPAYRTAAARFMFNDAVLKATRKLKDANGLYLWQPSVQAGIPSTFLGSGYVINQDMAVPAAGAKSVLYGDFATGYVIRLVKAFELIRLNERYADYGQVGFIGFDRADGMTQDTNAYKALTQAAV